MSETPAKNAAQLVAEVKAQARLGTILLHNLLEMGLPPEVVRYYTANAELIPDLLRKGFHGVVSVPKAMEEWSSIYQRFFLLERLAFAQSWRAVKWPITTPEFTDSIVVSKDLTFERLLEVCQKTFDFVVEVPDKLLNASTMVNDRDSLYNTYVVWARKNPFSDPELAEHKFDVLQRKNMRFMTLTERLLLEFLAYQCRAENYRDKKTATFCLGTRFSDKTIPLVGWDERGRFGIWQRSSSEIGRISNYRPRQIIA